MVTNSNETKKKNLQKVEVHIKLLDYKSRAFEINKIQNENNFLNVV